MLDVPQQPPIPQPSWNYIWGWEKRWTANFTCPNGHAGYLGDHTIAPDGTVSPSVVCPVEGCGFHDFIRLAGWDFGKPPMGEM